MPINDLLYIGSDAVYDEVKSDQGSNAFLPTRIIQGFFHRADLELRK